MKCHDRCKTVIGKDRKRDRSLLHISVNFSVEKKDQKTRESYQQQSTVIRKKNSSGMSAVKRTKKRN